MSRKKRIIEKLTEEQKSSLEKGHQTGKKHSFRKKCHCILLSHEGKSMDELSELYKVGRNTICIWFNLWETEGIKGLHTKPGQGRPPKLSIDNESHTKTIKTLIENEPQNLNRVVGQVKSELSIDLSKKTLQRFLKNLNMSGNAFDED